jgi:hypothetical protein
VVGENSTQKTIEVCVRIPRQKPPIEQVIDVFVRRLRITRVNVIPDKVVVCGDFEIKAIYVACLPDQPVHAVELRRVRFTADIPIYGAVCGMDADAGVDVEFVDYDCDPMTRARWYKENYDMDGHHGHHGHGHHHEECEEEEECHHECCPPIDCGHTRKFDVTVVLNVWAKVMSDRQVLIYPGVYPGLPAYPKG